MTKQTATERGVTEAFDFWLSQRPITVPEIMEAAIKAALKEWLDDNHVEIVEAIAKNTPAIWVEARE